MNRLTAAATLSALALAPAALAQDNPQAPPPAVPPPAATPPPPAAAPSPPAAPQESAADAAALQGKVEANEATLAEVKAVVDRLNRLKFSGYVQARWAWREVGLPDSSPVLAYNTTPAIPVPQNGFYIRRARLKTVYDADLAQFVLQIDAIPAGSTTTS
jgi:hypothetical protein